MKITFIRVIILFLLLLPQLLQAQKGEMKAELDVRLYLTEVFKTADTALINNWIKNTARQELKYITGSKMESESIERKVLCDFITGNWNEIKNISGKLNAGLKILSALAKFNADFNNSYIEVFDKSIDSLSKDEKIRLVGNAISIIGKAENLYESELKKLSAESSISDTSLLPLFRGFVYMQLYPIIQNELEKYIQKTISENFTKADSLRGTLTPERNWWNVLRYDITIKPDYKTKTIAGKNNMQYKVINDNHPLIMQVDLQEPMQIDSIVFNDSTSLDFKSYGNAWYVTVPEQEKSSENSLLIYFHGKPREAKRPPWDGGWVWSKDSLGNPWMSAACQGFGASVWFPCKEHQSDEPDNGASLSVIVSNTLVAVANGRLQSKQLKNDGTTTYKWEVISPINNYNIIPYIGKYVNLSDTYHGENGKLDVGIWVLDYNLERAKTYLIPEVQRTFKVFEHWFGPYPFYEDGYKLIDAPYAGMEHQSAIAYGNKYKNGFWGRDLSGSGWGTKWDYIIVHESGHEWFGNNITTNDIADMWVHEGFTCYSETIFTEYWYGEAAGNEYNIGLRKNIQNNFPVIGFYGVNDVGRRSDMYTKGSSLLHTIRHSMDDDEKFRSILRNLNKTFYHQTVTSQQIEEYINQHSGYDYSKVFDQYLRTVQIPKFEFYFSEDKNTVHYRYTDCVKDFDLPLTLRNENVNLKIFPSPQWNSREITSSERALFDALSIENMYYIKVKEVIVK